LTLPLYFAAEKWQILERETIRHLAPKIARIKQAFSGDEQYLILSTYYRQNRYHPFYALRSTFGLLVQVPFFIAAYAFISNLTVLQGCPFFFIRDLSAPDRLLALDSLGIRINILPVLMTLINCMAGFVYTKDFPVREKVQLYGIAAIFLVLLYNSPAALVLYWTLNNVFSLLKNILQKTPYAKKIIFITLCIFSALLSGYLLFFHGGALPKRITACVAAIAVCILWAAEKNIIRRFDMWYRDLQNKPCRRLILFLLIACNLFLLSGAVIPLSLIASSPQEFSFIEPYQSPFPIAIDTLLQAAGTFLFLPICLYALLSRRIKTLITLFLAGFLSVAVINTFVIQGDYGSISNILTFENPFIIIPHGTLKIISIIVCFILPVITVILFSSTLKVSLKVITQCYAMLVAIFVFFSAYNAYGIQTAYTSYAAREEQTDIADIENGWRGGGWYTFSETGKNVLIIMLDRGISGYVPFIFDEKPELYDTFSGFTWYPNTVTLGGFTITGTPPLYGGYEYAPLEMQKRNREPLAEKHNEALLTLPRLFSENDWETRVMDPPWANHSWVPDISIYAPYPNIKASNIIGEKTTSLWEKNGDGTKNNYPAIDISRELHQKMLRFSLFKCAPAFMRFFLYDNGHWLLSDLENASQLPRTLINEYAALGILPEITRITKENKNTFTIMSSCLTHEPGFLQFPDYTLAEHVTDKGQGQFSDESHYHVNMAAFLLLQKWFRFLQENNAYDNTRIVIVSDHGSRVNVPNNMTLPDGKPLAVYTALLMVKDFGAQGGLKTDNTFMTNADTPSLAVSELIKNPINPFSGKLIAPAKENGVTITASPFWLPKQHFRNTFKADKDGWMFVKDDIFKKENWKIVEIDPIR
jgi:YidC/Oxa1 family membrane protein insertase